MLEPEPEVNRTALTISAEEEPHKESDQGCEPATPEAEGMLVEMETEDRLMDFNAEVLTPTQSHPVLCSSLLF